MNEMPFDGHATIVVSFKKPDMLVHAPNECCGIQEPHKFEDCMWADWPEDEEGR